MLVNEFSDFANTSNAECEGQHSHTSSLSLRTYYISSGEIWSKGYSQLPPSSTLANLINIVSAALQLPRNLLVPTRRKARPPNGLARDSRALPLRPYSECRLLLQILSSHFL